FRRRTPRAQAKDQRYFGFAHERAQRATEFFDVSLQAGRGAVDKRIFYGHRVDGGLIFDPASGCIEIEQPCMLEQGLPLHGTMKSPVDQKTLNPLDGFARRVMYLEHDLLDLAPVLIRDSFDDVQLAFFGINLEKIDFVDLVLPDDVRYGHQLTFVNASMEPVRRQ